MLMAAAIALHLRAARPQPLPPAPRAYGEYMPGFWHELLRGLE